MKSQSTENFYVVDAIVNLVNYKTDRITNAQKLSAIIDTLRKFDLFEIEYDGDRSFEKRFFRIPKRQQGRDTKMTWEQLQLELQQEKFSIQMLNENVEFKVFLN
ncbi:MAG: hypothetical protein K9G40_12305 [Crocinitomicaceae bacterium]|nr:hypothetical protein [Crocinitomicaceae bacterium]MCF8432942.1 hypothetical protein [Crocinitomicaceae bacterium]